MYTMYTIYVYTVLYLYLYTYYILYITTTSRSVNRPGITELRAADREFYTLLTVAWRCAVRTALEMMWIWLEKPWKILETMEK